MNLYFLPSSVLSENHMPLPEDSLAPVHTTPAGSGSVLKVTILLLFKVSSKTMLN